MQQLVELYRPRKISDFAGIQTPRRVLEAFVKKPYPASWLLMGPSGIGKTSIAFAAAEAIGGEIHHIPSRDCDKDAVDRVCSLCQYRPMMGGDFHHIICDEANRMTGAAQLAFLSKLDCSAPPPDSIFWFTANDNNEEKTLEDRFVSRCRKLVFKRDEQLAAESAALMQRIWEAEAPAKRKQRPPDFAAMLHESALNVRAALMLLETELLCPGSFVATPNPVLERRGSEGPPDSRLHVLKSSGNARQTGSGTLYSIGYARLTVNALRTLATALAVSQIADCRFSPLTSYKGFSSKELQRNFGDLYVWKGRTLGGGQKTTPEGLLWLVETLGDGQNVLLLCKEESPGNCHRHTLIALPLFEDHGITTYHVFRDELVTADELERSIAEERAYESTRWRTAAALELA